MYLLLLIILVLYYIQFNSHLFV